MLAIAVPMTFQGKDGKQYVAVTAANGGAGVAVVRSTLLMMRFCTATCRRCVMRVGVVLMFFEFDFVLAIRQSRGVAR